MSKALKKSAKAHAKKTPTKLKAKAKIKVKSKAKAVAKPESSQRGFMWKVLELKERKLKEQHQNSTPNPMDRERPTASTQGFARFNGPRRKVG